MFEGNWTYSFQDMLVFDFFVLYCFCQYIDNINEKNWQNVVMNMSFCQYFAKILCIKVYCIFTLKNFVLQLGQSVPSVPTSLC